jgi:ABC-type transport system substrate-binding protein
MALIFYLNAFFFQFQFLNFPFIKNARVRWFVSLAISSLLAALAIWLASEAINAITKSKP